MKGLKQRHSNGLMRSSHSVSGIDAAAKVGVTCVIHPGGSIRDQEVIDAADEHNMVMVLTGMRHFRLINSEGAK